MANDDETVEDTSSRGAADRKAAPLDPEDFLPPLLNVLAGPPSQALSRIFSGRNTIDLPEWRGPVHSRSVPQRLEAP